MQQLNECLLKKLHEVFTSNKYKLSHSAVHLYGYYVFQLYDTTKTHISVSNKWITEETGLSTTTIVKARKELQAVGLIKVKKEVNKQMGNLPLIVQLTGITFSPATMDETKEPSSDRGHQALFGFDLAVERAKHFNSTDNQSSNGKVYLTIKDEETTLADAQKIAEDQIQAMAKRCYPPSTNREPTLLEQAEIAGNIAAIEKRAEILLRKKGK